jgi:hypothetical protein
MSEKEMGDVQPALPQQDLDTPEADPYSPEGALGKWLEGVTPEDPKYLALSDRALEEVLQGDIRDPQISETDKDVAISTLGALKLQMHNNRRVPGYVSAGGELHEIVKKSLFSYTQTGLMTDGISRNHLDSQTYLRIGGGLNDSLDKIVSDASEPKLPQQPS